VTLVGADGTVLLEARAALLIAAPQPAVSETRERALRFLRKGNEMLAEGQVAPARPLFERGADLGLAEATMALAATYDPAELGRRPQLRGIQPDLEQARRWYERARMLGAPEAGERLRRLGR
jgi:TPR repeat protein